jgi:ABC-type branched-subunit amino acid transport system substrate-binding protein
VLGKKLELITRDDNANPGDAVRVAEELVSREKIDVLAGTFLSNTGLAWPTSPSRRSSSSWPASRSPTR